MILADIDPAPSLLAPLLIASPDEPVTGIVTSPVAFGLVLHAGRERCRGRSLSPKFNPDNPRSLPRCLWCRAGDIPEWHAYLSVLVHADDGHVIVRLGPESLDPLAAYYDRFHSLRGAVLRTRLHGVQLKRAAPADGLPAALNIPAVLGWTAKRKDDA